MSRALCKNIQSVCLGMLLALLVSNPFSVSGQISQNMSLLGNWDDNNLPARFSVTYNDVWGYAANGREYAILGVQAGTYVLDVTNPSSPTIVSYLPGNGNSLWRDYKTYQHYLYAVADEPGARLQIFDLSNLPASVTKVYESDALFGQAHNIFIDQSSGRMYVAGSDKHLNGFMIIDLTNNPANPSSLVNYYPGYVHDLYSKNDTLYCYLGTWGMQSYDLTNLASPGFLLNIATYPEQGYCHSGWVTSDSRYMVFGDETHNTGIKLYNISNPFNPQIESVFRSTLLAPTHTNSVPHNMMIEGNYVYISYYHDGIQQFDISDPKNPVRVAYYDTYPSNTDYSNLHGAWGVYTKLPSGNILASDTDNGLFILQSSFLFPIELESFTAVSQTDRIALNWSTLTETNNEKFVIERSADGQNFEPISEVPGSGTSTQRVSYKTYDLNPLDGVAYYRLKQIDIDGQSSYSDVISVLWGEPFKIIGIYPNPVSSTTSELKTQFILDQDQEVRIRVIDLLGNLIYESRDIYKPGQHTLSVPTNQWAAGSYYLSMVAGSYSQTQKVIILD